VVIIVSFMKTQEEKPKPAFPTVEPNPLPRALPLLALFLFPFQAARYFLAAWRGFCADCGRELIETPDEFLCPECDIRRPNGVTWRRDENGNE
jgi:hypothetical protein